MDIEVNPLVLLIGIIQLSLVSSVLSDAELIGLLALTLTVPFLFRCNPLKILLTAKIILLTAALILIFGFIGEKETITAIAECSRFLSLVIISLLFVEKADLISLSTTLGRILSFLPGGIGWRISSALMMSLASFPFVFECGEEMLLSRKSRSFSFMHNPVKSLTEYTVSLMRLLFEKMIVFQDALYSRSFSVKEERTSYPIEKRDVFLLVFFIIIFSGVMLWKKKF